MSEQELNSYRLTSLEDPTDEMLSVIMREAAEDAKVKKEKALREYFDNIRKASNRRYTEEK